MKNLCICGKEEDCKQLKQRIKAYSIKKGIEVNIIIEDSVDKIVDKVKMFDIILLDMNEKNNKVLEKLFSEKNRKIPALLFFSSSYSKLKNKSYDFCFMVKAMTHSPLEITLNGLISRRNEEKTILVHDGLNQICLSLDDIMYIEADNKKLGIRTLDDFIVIKETLSDIERKILSNCYNSFYKPHRSYLVNMKYIKAFNQKYIIMYNDEKILISRLRKNEFVDKFSGYLDEEREHI